jgi:hypothetical protein
MADNFAQDAVFNNTTGEQCVSQEEKMLVMEAGKMSKVTAQALLSLITWSG